MMHRTAFALALSTALGAGTLAAHAAADAPAPGSADAIVRATTEKVDAQIDDIRKVLDARWAEVERDASAGAAAKTQPSAEASVAAMRDLNAENARLTATAGSKDAGTPAAKGGSTADAIAAALADVTAKNARIASIGDAGAPAAHAPENLTKGVRVALYKVTLRLGLPSEQARTARIASAIAGQPTIERVANTLVRLGSVEGRGETDPVSLAKPRVLRLNQNSIDYVAGLDVSRPGNDLNDGLKLRTDTVTTGDTLSLARLDGDATMLSYAADSSNLVEFDEVKVPSKDGNPVVVRMPNVDRRHNEGVVGLEPGRVASIIVPDHSGKADGVTYVYAIEPVAGPAD